jgi:hypothetical protein
VKPDDILIALQDLTGQERVEFLPLAETRKPSPYPPIEKYLLDLKNGSKPETAAEDLFTALCEDVLGFHPTRQVGVKEGFVDFILPEKTGEIIPLELKPLFQRDGTDAVWSKDANPSPRPACRRSLSSPKNLSARIALLSRRCDSAVQLTLLRISAFANADEIGCPPCISQNRNCPPGFTSRKTYSPFGLSLMSTAPKRIPNYGHSSRKKQLPAGDGIKTWARSPTTFTAFVTTVQLVVVKSEFCCNVAPTLVGQEMTAVCPASAADGAMLNHGGFTAVQIPCQLGPAL